MTLQLKIDFSQMKWLELFSLDYQNELPVLAIGDTEAVLALPVINCNKKENKQSTHFKKRLHMGSDVN